ncbi:MAG TPA: hypothetical protein PKA58_04535 [Polyangium sp.]|nr:hypothetical protein [Polyangium sp.]
MRVHSMFSSAFAAVLAFVLVPLGCGGAQEDYTNSIDDKLPRKEHEQRIDRRIQ